MAADRRLLCAQTFIAGIAAEVENDWRKSLSGSWGVHRLLWLVSPAKLRMTGANLSQAHGVTTKPKPFHPFL
jgi:hypothetical protein